MAALTPITASALDLSTSSVTYAYSGDLGTPVRIPAASLPSGKKFLVLYQVSMGANSTQYFGQCYLVRNRTGSGDDPELAHAEAESFDHGTPAATGGTNLNGFCVFTGNGTDALEFVYRAYVSSVSYSIRSDVPILAIPLDQTGAELVENTDYWVAQGDLTAGDTADATTQNSSVDCQTLTANISESGNYLLLASCEVKGDTVNDVREVSVTVDGVLVKRQWRRHIEDSRDRGSFFLADYIPLTPGQHTIKIVGDGDGSGNKSFYRSRIFLARAGAFDQLTGASGGSIVTTEYPTYTDMASLTYTPNQSENVVLIGTGFPYRTNAGGMLQRLYNSTAGASISGPAGEANVASIDQDRPTTTLFGVANLSSAATIKVQAAGEQNYGSTVLTLWCVDADVIAWSMTLKPVDPPDFTEQVNETMTLTEGTVTQPGAVVAETLAMAEGLPLELFSQPGDTMTIGSESVVYSVQNPGGVVSAAHPRLWLNPTRLAQLRALAGYDNAGNQTNPPGSTFWQDLISSDGQTGYARTFAQALAYKISLNTSYRDSAIAEIDAYIASCVSSPVNFGGQKDYLYFRDNMRDVALCLDWLWDDLTEAKRTSWINWIDASMVICWNDDAAAATIYDDSNWAINDITNNHYQQKVLGTVYGALATYYERRPTFTWNGTTYDNYWYMDNRDPDTTIYTDLWQFVVDKLEEQALPGWGEDLLGGGWREGANYGRGAHRSILEALVLIKEVAGVDYIYNPQYAYFRDIPRFYFYYAQPGYGLLHPDGELSGSENYGAMSEYNRMVMLLAARGLAGTTEGGHARYWLENIQTSNHPDGFTTAFDFLWDDPTYTAVNPFSTFPLAYQALGSGFAFSRSAWSSSAIAVTCQACNINHGHMHKNMGAVNIFGGAGSLSGVDKWQVVETQAFGTQADINSSIYHNVWTIGGTWQRHDPYDDPLPIATLERFGQSDASKYMYCHMNMDDAYWTGYVDASNSHGTTKISENVTRDVFHIRPEYVVAYDRVKNVAGREADEIVAHWHYPRTQPTIGSDIIKHDNGTNRIFQKIVQPSGYSITWTDELVSTGTQDTWRANVSAPSHPAKFLWVFESTNTSKANMSTVTALASQGMEGVYVDDATEPFVCMFATGITAAAPGTFAYSYTEPVAACVNYVANLKTNFGYGIITSTDLGARSVQISEGGNYQTTSAGVLVFDPANLTAYTGITVTVNESLVMGEATPTTKLLEAWADTLSMSESVTGSIIYPTNDSVDETMTMTEAVVTRPAALTDEAMSMSESVITKPTQSPANADTMTIGSESVSYWITAPVTTITDPDGDAVNITVEVSGGAVNTRKKVG